MVDEGERVNFLQALSRDKLPIAQWIALYLCAYMQHLLVGIFNNSKTWRDDVERVTEWQHLKELERVVVDGCDQYISHK